jgi:predicted ATPase
MTLAASSPTHWSPPTCATRPQYRLLDTTRLYAFNKLRSAAELPEAARCHAEYYCGLFAHAEAESESRP